MAIISKDNGKFKNFINSIQLKIAFTYVFMIAVVLLLMNTYSLTVTRNLIFSTKKTSIQSQGAVISKSLSALDRLSVDGAAQVFALLDVSGLDRIVVYDPDGETLYQSENMRDTESADVSKTHIRDALDGNDVYYSKFDGSAFNSYFLSPIALEGGSVIGAVYLYEHDAEQGQILLGLQNNLKNISIIAAVITIGMIILFSRTVITRISRVLEAIKTVREGEYNYKVEIRGKDELSHLGDEFNRLTERLKSTEEIRRRFVSDASHELKTPLASIRLLSDSILQNENIDRKIILEFVEDIGEESERLARTTEKLLNLTRLDNEASSEKHAVDLKEVILRTLRMLMPLANDKSVAITYRLDDGCTVLASQDDMYRIIFNIVENGIKYNVFGGNVYIRLRRDSETIFLTFDDTGIGIPEEDLPNIFNRFYRVDKARSREAGGSGLGLSIVRDTLRLHGGSIEAIPRDGGGMRFRVLLPLHKPDESE